MRPVVGIISNHLLIDEQYPVHTSGTMNGHAIANISRCIPLIVPSDPAQVTVEELMANCDGFLFTGGRPNVHPDEYGEVPEMETKEYAKYEKHIANVSNILDKFCEELKEVYSK